MNWGRPMAEWEKGEKGNFHIFPMDVFLTAYRGMLIRPSSHLPRLGFWGGMKEIIYPLDILQRERFDLA
jgi:hypothetical protein